MDFFVYCIALMVLLPLKNKLIIYIEGLNLLVLSKAIASYTNKKLIVFFLFYPDSYHR